MKRYLLFAGEQYYPCGGVFDLHGAYAIFEECKECAEKLISKHKDYTWWNILDLETGKVFSYDTSDGYSESDSSSF